MKLVYEAQNTVEAHMILNLLEQAGLSARIDGEYLQGGVGELQTMGIVRVMIEASDYLEGREIIKTWEQQPLPPMATTATQSGSGFVFGIAGFFLGMVAMAAYYSSPVTVDGIDYNRDGQLDEQWTYRNNLIVKVEQDRNLDGKMDLISHFDRRGLIKSSTSDDNFDNTFETIVSYLNGNATFQRSDSTGDGFMDYRVEYTHGLATKVRFVDPVTERVVKLQEFGPIRLTRAQMDSNGDGRLDTRIEYNTIEEIIRRVD